MGEAAGPGKGDDVGSCPGKSVKLGLRGGGVL